LFRREHVGQSKAKTAEIVLNKNRPNMKIISYNKNIMDKDLGLRFFSKFDLIFMALDNAEAR